MVTLEAQIRKKGQMTLPAEVRRELGVEDGDRIYFQKINGRYQLVTRDQIIDPTAGALSKYGDAQNPSTIEEMDRAVQEAILEKWDRFVRETEAGYDE